MEVMIAMSILFLGTFAVLNLVSSLLANARHLQRPLVDASAVLSQFSLTNKLSEGPWSGNLGDMLGKQYQEYNFSGVVTEVGSNRLFQADFAIFRGNNRDPIARTTTLFYRPQSDPGSLDGGNFIK